jgi:hypothetical protein
MYSSQANAFALRLHANQRLREEVAKMVGLSLADFDEKAEGALNQVTIGAIL